MWCIQKITPEYRKRMYDILDLYQQPYDPLMPVIGFDEKPKQLVEDSRSPILMQPGKSEKKDAERILSKLEFHYTPKHASWLNVAEIEIGVMDNECTDRRMKNISFLKKEVGVWTKRRNNERCTIDWRFTRADADKKLAKHYVT